MNNPSSYFGELISLQTVHIVIMYVTTSTILRFRAYAYENVTVPPVCMQLAAGLL